MLVLGIETSCDETGLALYDTERGLLGHTLFSQIDLHRAYGGVVPELASRDHITRVLPLLHDLLNTTGKVLDDIDGIAYTAGPGLVGALMVGASFAEGLAFSRSIPTMGVHHMEGHLLAPMLEPDAPKPPYVALLVSGGHTSLIDVQALGQYVILGESRDDAAGEAFDKSAKLMGLPYPGGPELAKLAQMGRPDVYRFPRPMTDRPGFDFSFSGLKTFTRNTFLASDQSEQTKADIARAFEQAVVDTLRIKCTRALEHTGYSQLVVAGGVSANTYLREQMAHFGQKSGFDVFYPRLGFCTDNGAMIALAGALRLAADQKQPERTIHVTPRWSLESLAPISG